jgi:long-chain fatty acid transport protein
MRSGSDGWFPGGGAFISHSVSPDLKLGFALAGNFGAPLEVRQRLGGPLLRPEYDACLACRWLPSVAFKVNDKLSLGAGLNAMYGIYTRTRWRSTTSQPDLRRRPAEVRR